MSGLSGMFGLLGAEGDETSAPAEKVPAPTAPGDEPRTGEANAALRNLLVDAKLKLLQFDDYRTFFAGLVEPATQALRTLEQAQAANSDLQRQFAEAATQCAELHARLHDIEAQQTLTASENDRLTGELDLARTQAREAEDARAALASEVAPKATALAELERQFAAMSAEQGELTQEAERLRIAASASDEKAGGMAADLAAALDKAGLVESELESLHKSLDDASEKSTGAARRLAESETALTAARTRLSQLEAVNEGLHAERDQLRAALDANGIKYDGRRAGCRCRSTQSARGRPRPRSCSPRPASSWPSAARMSARPGSGMWNRTTRANAPKSARPRWNQNLRRCARSSPPRRRIATA